MWMDSFDVDDDFESILLNSDEVKKVCDTAATVEPPPNDFGCTLKPYKNQLDFMRAAYATLEEGKIGIFQSPTGTGKSLSILCATLTWLHRQRQRQLDDCLLLVEEKSKELQDCNGDNWVEEYERKCQAEEVIERTNEFLEYLRAVQKRLDVARKGISQCHQNRQIAAVPADRQKRKQTAAELEQSEQEEAEDFLLEDFTSRRRSDSFDRDKAAKHRMKPQVYFCSRTHSQLAQFAREIKKTAYADSTHLITLGSRATLCINSAVLRLGRLQLINEKCLDMVEDCGFKKIKCINECSTASSRCPFLRQDGISQLADEALCLNEIDDVLRRGKEMTACPYYASRSAIVSADLILMPYQVLLQKTTRQTYGLTLPGNVVIIDEAHNLLDTIESIHGVQISIDQLKTVNVVLDIYLSKYRGRFSPKNLKNLLQLQRVVQCSLNRLTSYEGEHKETALSSIDFVLELGLEAINFFSLNEFIETSGFCRKMRGFLKSIGPAGLDDHRADVFFTFHSYVQCFMNDIGDGRFIIEKVSDVLVIKFILLNPAVYFEDILKEARAVLLAGGTMEPVNELQDRLFNIIGIPRNRITFFSCGHVVPDSNILPLIVSRGPTEHYLNFSYGCRDNHKTLEELGSVLLMLSRDVPGGMVCFFPSYEFERLVYDYLSRSVIWEQLNHLKPVHREPKKAMEVAEVLEAYGKRIRQRAGAMLFAVVGGKMSEGINFADDLCRCVLVVGLPYANSSSVELQQKMKYLDASFSRPADSCSAGREYYENLCFKAVNQSVGRAIRHATDYSSMVFLDCRYANRKCWSKLPSWMQNLIQQPGTFNRACELLRNFYNARSANSSNSFIRSV